MNVILIGLMLVILRIFLIYSGVVLSMEIFLNGMYQMLQICMVCFLVQKAFREIYLIGMFQMLQIWKGCLCSLLIMEIYLNGMLEMSQIW
jgi:hypothetical protein